MSRIRAVFLGTPEIARTCLEAMIKDEHFEVVGVVSQPDRPSGRKLQLTPSPVKALVQPLGIPVLTPESINSDEAINQVIALRAEVAVVVAFGQILSQRFLDLFPQRVVNLHASLLPRWRGAAPVQRALMAGDSETGISLQIVVRKMDAGPVLGFRHIPVLPETTAVEVYSTLAKLGPELISIELMDYLRGHLTPIKQDESLITMAPKIARGDAIIDWNWSAETIHNWVRGLAAGPIATTYRPDAKPGTPAKVVKIHRTKVDSTTNMTANLTLAKIGSPGQLQPDATGLYVVCGQGRLQILELQPESRSRMSAADYMRGYPVGPSGTGQGDIFGSGESLSRST